MSQTDTKIETVADCLQLYIDGVTKGDAAKLERAFHPDARMFGALGDQRVDVPIADMIALIVGQPADVDGTFEATVRSLEECGDTAVAAVDEKNFWGTVSFTDYFSLARIDGSWTIVNKVFAHTGGTPPGA
ncbi:MAG: nuclear transport factor 2 family protein [Planctomycetota bacterium]